MNRLIKRLAKRRGETLAETLAALLIIALALTMLASMLTTSQNIASRSDQALRALYEQTNRLEEGTAGLLSANEGFYLTGAQGQVVRIPVQVRGLQQGIWMYETVG